MLPKIARMLAVALLLAAAAPVTAQSGSYCSGAPNSAGPGATIRWEGLFNPWMGQVVVEGLPRSSMGLFTYSLTAQRTPFGDGVRCIGNTNWVLARKRATLGAVTLNLASEAEPSAMQWLMENLPVQIHVQYMYRDPRANGTGFNLSNAVRVTLGMGT